jgi:hypothetical protein
MGFLLPDPMASWTTIDILHFNVVGSRHYWYTIISCKQNSQFWKRGFVGLMETGKWSSHAIVESKGWVFGNGNFYLRPCTNEMRTQSKQAYDFQIQFQI